jgi:formylglycine-generating enzyme required for sulfatase activity
MWIRTVCALSLLLLPSSILGQDIDASISALVRISGVRDATPVRGSGFVVALNRDQATIVTASHVVEGVKQIAVTFAVDPTKSLLGEVLEMEAGNPNGLATLVVHGALPEGVSTLSLDTKSRPPAGAALFLLGFHQNQVLPYTAQRYLAGRNGTLLLIDQHIGEGFSGGPVVLGGKAVGVVTDADDDTTYAVNAMVVHEVIDGWRIKLGEPASAEVGENCVSGERTENGIVFVRICPGTFIMGSADDDLQAADDEKPAHQVTLSEFWIGKTEITNQQFRLVYPKHQGAPDLPAAGVSWDEANVSCEHFGGRLPTEAEWEYAARAGSQAAWFGNLGSALGDYAWFSGNSERKVDKPARRAWAWQRAKAELPVSRGELHPVGTRQANPWGLQDMYGNALEWVADAYRPYPRAAQRNPQKPAKDEFHVLRGGSCYSTPKELRSASRRHDVPSSRYEYFGFRCVLSRSQP